MPVAMPVVGGCQIIKAVILTENLNNNLIHVKYAASLRAIKPLQGA